MLLIRTCRNLLGPTCRVPDADLEALRAQMYALAHALLDAAERSADTPPLTGREPWMPILRLLPAELREEFEERAAIREFDGGMDRAAAEDAAMRECLDRRKRLRR
jgi:hypothetical protein